MYGNAMTRFTPRNVVPFEAFNRAIEEFFDQISENGQSLYQRAKSSIHDCADMAREQYEHVTQRVRDGYGQAEDLVKRRPAESAALVFGVGLIAGVLVSTLLRR